jgi:hypothetical protein
LFLPEKGRPMNVLFCSQGTLSVRQKLCLKVTKPQFRNIQRLYCGKRIV